jgi:hypothetical protein
MSEVDELEIFRMDEDPLPFRAPAPSPVQSVSYDLRSRRIVAQGNSPGRRPVYQAILGRGSEENFNCSNGRDAGDTSDKEDDDQLQRGVSPMVLEERRKLEERRMMDRMDAMMENMRRMEVRMETVEKEALDTVRLHRLDRRPEPTIRVSTHPPQFDGSEDWKSFLVRFENCAQMAGWNELAKTKMLSCCLTKSAQKFYSELPENDRENYERLTMLLGQRFGDGPPETYQALLASRTRKAHESVHELKDDIWRLVGKAYPDITHKMQETMTLQTFSQALSTDIRVHLLSRNVRTLQDAVTAVESYEAIIKKTAGKDRKTDHGEDVRVYALQDQQLQGRGESVKTRDPESLTCYGCGKKGHIARNCTAEVRRNKLVCYRCGEQGHLVRDCTSEKKSEKDGPKCYVCGSPDHLAPRCPQRKGNGKSPDQN